MNNVTFTKTELYELYEMYIRQLKFDNRNNFKNVTFKT
jgi:hypothetical protein